MGGLDIKRVLLKYAKNWYFFAIAIVIAYLFANDKNKYLVPRYSLKTTVLIEDKSNSSVLQERGAISSAPLYLSSKLVDNQIALLKSFAQIKRIIQNLDFEVSYFAKGQYIYTEIYKESPFVVEFDKEHNQVRYRRIFVKFTSPTQFQLWSESYDKFKNPKNYTVGDSIISRDYSFLIRFKDGSNPKDFVGKDYAFQINDINGLTGHYMNVTSVYIERNTSMLVISSSGENKQKEKDYLNQLTIEFLISNLEKKNKILTNTINFIEQQLVKFGEELNEIEEVREQFRKTNQFMLLEEKIGTLVKNMNDETKDGKNLRIDLAYYQYLKNYIEEREDFDEIVMPSSMGVNLPMFNALIGKLSLAILERDNLLGNANRNNPYIQILDRDIALMKAEAIESMRSTIETTEIKLAETDRRLFELHEDFMTLPRLEREFIAIDRSYKIINSLYDFLLKRKAEVEIQRAANTPDHEIVDYAGDTGISNLTPKPKSAIMNAMIWAILLPSVFLFLLVFLNNRVMAIEDVEAITDVPIAGTVAKTQNRRMDGVLKSPNSYFTELLRIIRIKIDLKPELNQKVVAVTSAAQAEGKTFIAANLASVYALTGKKTLLLGFDLRRPEIAEEFGLDPYRGITSYLINDIPVEEVIQHTFTRNLDILLAGPIPPNPDELIESEKTRKMFEELRERYFYIVMDTPSIGLFGDAFLLNKYSDATVFIVRHNFTRKVELSNAIVDAVNNSMKKLFIVYNDIPVKIKDKNIGFYDEQKSKSLLILQLKKVFGFVGKMFNLKKLLFGQSRFQVFKKIKGRYLIFLSGAMVLILLSSLFFVFMYKKSIQGKNASNDKYSQTLLPDNNQNDSLFDKNHRIKNQENVLQNDTLNEDFDLLNEDTLNAKYATDSAEKDFVLSNNDTINFSSVSSEYSLPDDTSGSKYFLIVGAFKSLENVNKIISIYSEQKFQPKIVDKTSGGLYRVSIADFSTKQEAEKKLQEIGEIAKVKLWILKK